MSLNTTNLPATVTTNRLQVVTPEPGTNLLALSGISEPKDGTEQCTRREIQYFCSMASHRLNYGTGWDVWRLSSTLYVFALQEGFFTNASEPSRTCESLLRIHLFLIHLSNMVSTVVRFNQQMGSFSSAGFCDVFGGFLDGCRRAFPAFPKCGVIQLIVEGDNFARKGVMWLILSSITWSKYE